MNPRTDLVEYLGGPFDGSFAPHNVENVWTSPTGERFIAVRLNGFLVGSYKLNTARQPAVLEWIRRED